MIDKDKTILKFGYLDIKENDMVIMVCDECGLVYEVKYRKSRHSNTVQCRSCRTRKLWRSEQFRNNIAKKSKELWSNNKYRDNVTKKCGEMSRKLWNDKHKRKIMSNKCKNSSLAMWNDDNYRNKISNNMKRQYIEGSRTSKCFKDLEFKEMMSDIIKELWKDNNYRSKLIEISGSKLNKSKISEGVKRRWNEDLFRDKMAIARANQPRVSNIQMMLYSILDDLDIKYYREYSDKSNDPETIVGPYNFDCMIPREGKPNLLIECQGDYWHSLDKAIKNDKSKSTYISEYYSDEYELKYLWEHEFYCKEKIIELLKYWLDITKLEINNFKFDDIKIKYPCEAINYKLLLSKYHYLPNAGRGGLAYGAYLGNELIAVCIFSSLSRQNIRIGNYIYNECLELSRFCIHPRYQVKNLGSWFISRCLKLLDEKYKLVISYCDTTFNHDGALYKACNFKQDGIVPADYWYVSSDGWVMHKKTLYNRAIKMKMKERKFAEMNNYKKVYGKNKIRFIYER